MKIDYNNPIIVSLLSIGITFIIVFIFLYITTPNYIMEISKQGKRCLSLYLLITYSLLFAVFSGIIMFFIKTENNNTSKPVKMGFAIINPRAYIPLEYSPEK